MSKATPITRKRPEQGTGHIAARKRGRPGYPDGTDARAEDVPAVTE